MAPQLSPFSGPVTMKRCVAQGKNEARGRLKSTFIWSTGAKPRRWPGKKPTGFEVTRETKPFVEVVTESLGLRKLRVVETGWQCLRSGTAAITLSRSPLFEGMSGPSICKPGLSSRRLKWKPRCGQEWKLVFDVFADHALVFPVGMVTGRSIRFGIHGNPACANLRRVIAGRCGETVG